MLILERRVGEKINIGDDIEIVVTQISNEWGKPAVKIGISAPKNMIVDRNEIHQRRKLGLEPKKKPKVNFRRNRFKVPKVG